MFVSCFCICYAKYPCINWLGFIPITVWGNQLTPVKGDCFSLQAVEELIKFSMKKNQKKPLNKLYRNLQN